MIKFFVSYPDIDENKGSDLSIEQRNLRGGAIGDALTLAPGEEAEVEMEMGGVQLTIEKVSSQG